MDYRTFGTYEEIKQLRAEGKITDYRLSRTGNTNMAGKWHLVFIGPDIEIWQKSKRGDAAFMTLDRIYTALRLLGFTKLEVEIEEAYVPALDHLDQDWSAKPEYRRPYRHHREKNNI